MGPLHVHSLLPASCLFIWFTVLTGYMSGGSVILVSMPSKPLFLPQLRNKKYFMLLPINGDPTIDRGPLHIFVATTLIKSSKEGCQDGMISHIKLPRCFGLAKWHKMRGPLWQNMWSGMATQYIQTGWEIPSAKIWSSVWETSSGTRPLDHARFICTICMRRIRRSCEGLTSVHNKYTGYTLKHLLLRHMYNLSLPMLMCYVLKPSALRLPTGKDVHWRMPRDRLLSHTVLCGVLYTACVDASRTVFWDRSVIR